MDPSGDMGPKIQIRRSGPETLWYVEAASQFRDELESAGIEFEHYVSYALEPVSLIALSILGSVASHYVIKLIDSLLEKKKERPQDGVKITIIDVSANITFTLPEEQQKAIDHFEMKEEETAGDT